MTNRVGRYYRVSTEEERSMSKNSTQIKAAVVREKCGPFSIETLSLEGPRRDEVLVRVVATGMCHTDMVARDKVYPVPHPRRRNRRERRRGCCQSRAWRFCRAHIPDMRTLQVLSLGKDGTLREDLPALLRRNAVGRQHCYTRRRWRESSRSLFRPIVVCDTRT